MEEVGLRVFLVLAKDGLNCGKMNILGVMSVNIPSLYKDFCFISLPALCQDFNFLPHFWPLEGSLR